MSTEHDTMPPPEKTRRRKKLEPGVSTSVYLEGEIEQLLTEYIAKSVPRVTKSAVIRAALRQFLGAG